MIKTIGEIIIYGKIINNVNNEENIKIVVYHNNDKNFYKCVLNSFDLSNIFNQNFNKMSDFINILEECFVKVDKYKLNYMFTNNNILSLTITSDVFINQINCLNKNIYYQKNILGQKTSNEYLSDFFWSDVMDDFNIINDIHEYLHEKIIQNLIFPKNEELLNNNEPDNNNNINGTFYMYDSDELTDHDSDDEKENKVCLMTKVFKKKIIKNAQKKVNKLSIQKENIINNLNKRLEYIKELEKELSEKKNKKD